MDTNTRQLRIAERSSRGAGRVLVVDDERSLLNALLRVLERASYEAVGALDGSEAIAALSAKPFDAIVSDVRMPAMTGLELLKVVRAFDMDVPVILMSGAPDVASMTVAIELGACRYLSKPVDSDALIAAVQRAVTLRKLADAKREAATITGGGTGPGERLALEVAFERTLAKLWVAFQPIVADGARDLYGYEALLRSDDPELRFPDAILAAAERLGRMHDVGRRVRTLVASAFRGVPPHVLCFINLHPLDLDDPQIYELEDALRPIARRVVLEITERGRLGDISDVQRRIAELRSFGFRIAIDDIGAGYSGLTNFVLLEPDLVKIDMSLVRGIDEAPMKQRVVQNLGTLCKDCGLDVIAEGVETHGERKRLVDLGFDLFQGYLFAKPGRPFPDVAWP